MEDQSRINIARRGYEILRDRKDVDNKLTSFLQEEEVKRWIERGGLNDQTCLNATKSFNLLHRACQEGLTECVHMLLEAKADIQFTAQEGGSPLHTSVFFRKKECVRLLLDRGADVNQKDSKGRTPLHLSVMPEVNQGNRPAVQSGSSKMIQHEIVGLLLDHNAIPSLSDEKGRDVLSYARTVGNHEVIKMLERQPKGVLAPQIQTATRNLGCQWKGAREASDGVVSPDRPIAVCEESSTIATDLDTMIDTETNKPEVRYGSKLDDDSDMGVEDSKTVSFNDCLAAIESNAPTQLAALLKDAELIWIRRGGLNDTTDTSCEGNRNAPGARFKSLVHEACERRRTRCLDVLLNRKADPNLKSHGSFGRAPIHIAVLSGDLDCLKILLDAKADVQKQDDDGKTAIEYAVSCDGDHDERVKIVDLLLSLSNVESVTKCMQHAGRSERIMDLLQRAQHNSHQQNGIIFERCSIFVQDFDAMKLEEYLHHSEQAKWLRMGGLDSQVDGWGLLHIACRQGAVECARVLIDMKAAIDTRSYGKPDIAGDTPLHVAVQSCKICCVALLIENRANQDLKSHLDLTALQMAVQNDCVDIVQILVDNNPDFSVKDKSGLTPVQYAKKMNLESTRILAAGQEKKIGFYIRQSSPFAPFIVAKQKSEHMEFLDEFHQINFQKCCDLIRDQDCKGLKGFLAGYHVQRCWLNLDYLNREGMDSNMQPHGTPLHQACELGLTEIAEVLLASRANPNVVDSSSKERPIHKAVRAKQIKCVELLMKNKALHDNVIDHQGRTPLHIAVEQEDYKMVQTLVRVGYGQATPSQDNNKNTPLHIAATKKSKKIVDILLSLPAFKKCVELENNQSLTALGLAIENDDAEVMKSLIKNGAQFLKEAARNPRSDECQTIAGNSSQWQTTSVRPNPEISSNKGKIHLAARGQPARSEKGDSNLRYHYVRMAKKKNCMNALKLLEDKIKDSQKLGGGVTSLAASAAAMFTTPSIAPKQISAVDAMEIEASSEPPTAADDMVCTSTLMVPIRNQLMWVKEFQYVKIEDLESLVPKLLQSKLIWSLLELKDLERHKDVKNFGARGRAQTQFDVIACTNGSLHPLIPPSLMLLTAEEAAVMAEHGAEVQKPAAYEEHLTPLKSEIHSQPQVFMRPFLEKHFHVPKPVRGLPPVSSMFSEAGFRKSARSEIEAKLLGNKKSELDELDIKVWKQHTSKTLITGDVVKYLRQEIKPEMCTKAFAKMYEMLAAYDLVRPLSETNHFNSLHVCEAPGAFICATNHYIKNRHPSLVWDWRACSLNPYFEGNNTDAMVDDDKFINETSENWYFGCDDTGDMRLRENIEGAIAEANKMDGPIMLVTADGSVDCSDVPNEQEEVTAQLHLCESIVAIGALHIGGCFVLKMFTLFEHSSIGIIYLLSCVFDQVFVCKPVMSTPGNSETYIIGCGFQGIDKEYLDRLLENTGISWPTTENVPRALIPIDWIERDWLLQTEECSRYFARLQTAVIQRNISLFHEFSQAMGYSIRAARQVVAQEWIRRFGIRAIESRNRIAEGKVLTGSSNRLGAAGRVKEGGSLAERIKKKQDRKRIRDGSEVENGEIMQDSGFDRVVKHARTLNDPLPTDSSSRLESLTIEEGSDLPDTTSNAWKIMNKMGHKKGEGLGKDSQGIQTPIQYIVKDDRAGLSYGKAIDIDRPGFAYVDVSSIIWIEQAEVLKELDWQQTSALTEYAGIVEGKRLLEFKRSKFCSEVVILQLLEARSKLQNLNQDSHASGVTHTSLKTSQALQRYFKCYEEGLQGFVSRSALKAEELIGLCGHLDRFESMVMVDLYGGRGGFTDHALATFGARLQQAFIVNRKGKTPPDIKSFKSAKLLLSADVLQVLCYASGQVDGSSLEELQVCLSTLQQGNVQYIIGDGVHKDPCLALTRSLESSSVKTFIVQCIIALETLGDGGVFTCRVADTFGRCMLGVLLLLASVFRKFTLIKPGTSCPAKPERFLICVGFMSGAQAGLVADHLREVIRRINALREMENSDKDIVAIVQQKYLMKSSTFVNSMIKMNERNSRQETVHINEFAASLDQR